MYVCVSVFGLVAIKRPTPWLVEMVLTGDLRAANSALASLSSGRRRAVGGLENVSSRRYAL